MSVTGLAVFDDTVHKTNTWLHEITSRMGWDDRRRSYRLLRLSLHAMRDRMPVGEVAHLSAQLPMLLRGVFFDGWQPGRTKSDGRNVDEFLGEIQAAFSHDPDFKAEDAFKEVISVMRMHITDGEFEDVRRVMPDAIKALWEDDF